MEAWGRLQFSQGAPHGPSYIKAKGCAEKEIKDLSPVPPYPKIPTNGTAKKKSFLFCYFFSFSFFFKKGK